MEAGDFSSGYEILFASSADYLNVPSTLPQTGALRAVLTKPMATRDLSFTIDASSLGDVIDFLATDLFSGTSQSQNIHTFTLTQF